jgi:hypothetical protein
LLTCQQASTLSQGIGKIAFRYTSDGGDGIYALNTTRSNQVRPSLTAADGFPFLSGRYLGQEPPGLEPVVLAPEIAFDNPRGDTDPKRVVTLPELPVPAALSKISSVRGVRRRSAHAIRSQVRIILMQDALIRKFREGRS